MNKYLGFGYGFKLKRFPINECFSKLQDCFHSKRPNKKLIFPTFGNDFYLHQDIILKVHPVIYPLKQKYICDHNIRFLMSIGLMFYDIIMNIFRNTELACHVKIFDSYLQIHGKIYMYIYI